MNPIEEGKAFTDDVYASKKEVEAYYNLNDVTKNWESVLRYRSYFDCETELKDNNSNHYKICLTKKMMADGYSFQMKLMNDLILFASLSKNSQNDFVLKQKMRAIQAVLYFSGKTNINQETVEKLALGELESIPSSLFLSDAYSKAYNKDFFNHTISVKGFDSINKRIIGSLEDDETSYRNEKPTDVKNPLIPCDSNDIPAVLENIVLFLNQEEIPAIYRALSTIFYFAATRPYEYFNEGTAALICKNFLADNGFLTLGFTLDFESIAFASGKNYYSHAKQTETSLDLTYYIVHVFPFLIKEEEDMHALLLELKKNDELQPQKLSEDVLVNDVTTESLSFALPVFPTAKQEDEIEQTAKKLREVYPQLKKKEAHFYAGHCTIGLNYTIEQFKKEEKTVYETARTSMDDLAKRGFYRKNKVQKKFVYTPIPLDLDKPNPKKDKEQE